MPNGFSLAAVGDLIQTHPLSPARVPGLAEVIGRLSGATVAFGNFESTAMDIRTSRAQTALAAAAGLTRAEYAERTRRLYDRGYTPPLIVALILAMTVRDVASEPSPETLLRLPS